MVYDGIVLWKVYISLISTHSRGRGIPASSIGLNVLPRLPGGPQNAVKPVSGQRSLADMGKVVALVGGK